MTSSGRELLKWIAVICMTCDHVATIVYGGHVPMLSQFGRIAFPLFAMVMAYNLAQERVDYAKSARRLLIWGLLAQPVHAWAFGTWWPLNVLLTFCLATCL
ncbi:TraX family protein, partial [Xanthomonas citri]